MADLERFNKIVASVPRQHQHTTNGEVDGSGGGSGVVLFNS
jgi:hypothetical protein